MQNEWLLGLWDKRALDGSGSSVHVRCVQASTLQCPSFCLSQCLPLGQAWVGGCVGQQPLGFLQMAQIALLSQIKPVLNSPPWELNSLPRKLTWLLGSLAGPGWCLCSGRASLSKGVFLPSVMRFPLSLVQVTQLDFNVLMHITGSLYPSEENLSTVGAMTELAPQETVPWVPL